MKKTSAKTGSDIRVIPRLLAFMALPQLVITPLRIFVESVIEGKTGAPDFVTVPFIIYGLCAELVFGIGYLAIGYKLPVKNTFLRAFAYIMLICFSSYLPNVLAMAGGDGEIIGASFSAGIVSVDIIAYIVKGIVLGLLMKSYDPEIPPAEGRLTEPGALLYSAANGALFALLNILTDIAAGAADSSWRLCSILKVSPEREASFYAVFTIFMFIAGLILPVWYRYCMPRNVSLSGAVIFGIKLSAAVWLPNVLIMAFFGTPVIITAAYGAAYIIMITVCILVYRKTVLHAKTALRFRNDLTQT